MLNELTPKDGERVALNAYRHAWSIVANIFVYGITWLLLDNNQTNDNTQMNANVFRVREFLFKILLKIIICRH
jgi:Na+/melibiose symporter-like transporter